MSEADFTNADVPESKITYPASTNGEGAPDPDAIKMFVGQIPRSWGENELRKLFEEYGSVYQLSVLRDKSTGDSRGCCFVTFYHRKDAIASQGALHNIKVLPGMHHPIQMKPADSENRNERKLFIGMISKKINETDVKAMFASFGLIEDCTVLRDAAGNSKGCAFVTFSSRASALNAIKAMHQSRTMEGCSMPMVVKFADTQRDKDQKKQVGVAGAHPLVGAPAAHLIPFATSAAAANPAMRHSSVLPGGTSIYGLLQNLQGVNAAAGGGLAQASGFPLLANQNLGAGLNPSSVSSLNSLAGYYGLNSQLAANGAPSAVNSMAALINYLLTAAAVSAPNANNVASNMVVANQSLLNAVPQSWKPSTMTSASPPAMNGNFIQITGTGGGAAAYLPQAYAAGGAIPYAAATAQSALGAAAAMTGNINATKQLEGPEGANLFIYHLPQEFTDADLAQTFAPFGTLLSAKVFVDKQTNLSKCFGFVSYENAVSAQSAIQAMNGFQIGTKRLKVQLKRSKQDAKPYQHPHNDSAKV